MPSFTLRRRAQKSGSTTVTTTDRVRAAVRIMLVVMLVVRLVRAVRRLPADIVVLRTPTPSAT